MLNRLRSLAPYELSVCATVRAELVYGALKSQDPDTQLAIVNRFLKPLTCYPVDDEVADSLRRFVLNSHLPAR